MQVRTWLNQLHTTQVCTIVQEWKSCGFPIKSSSRSTTIEQLCDFLTNPQQVRGWFETLKHAEKEVLHFFMYIYCDQLCTAHELESHVRPIERLSIRIALVSLQRKGLIYRVKQSNHITAYGLVSDVHDVLYTSTYHRPVDAIHDSEVVQDHHHPPVPSVVGDLFIILHDLNRIDRQAIPLNASGMIPERVLKRWQSKIENRNDYLEGVTSNIHQRLAYVCQHAALIDFLSEKGMFQWLNGHLTVHWPTVERWMDKPAYAWLQDWLQHWNDIHTPSTSWLRRFKRDMLMNQAASWHYVLDYVEQWEETYSLPSVSTIVHQLEQEVILPLVGWGIIEYGQTIHGEKVWRWKPTQNEKAEIWIQPDMSMFVSERTPLFTMWHMSQMCEMERWQPVLRFELDETRIRQAEQRAGAGTVKKWMDEATKQAEISFPSSWQQTIQTWLYLSSIEVVPMVVVKIGENEQTEVMKQCLESEDIAWEELAPNQLLVAQSNIEAVNRIIHMHGWPVNHSASERDPLLKTVHFREGKKPNRYEPSVDSYEPIVTEKWSDQLAQLDCEIPSVDRAFPQWHTFPKSWREQMLAYHPHTKIDIIRTSIQYQLPIKVETNSGHCQTFIPMKLHAEDGQWKCMDMHGKQCSIEEMQKMQLLFPALS